MGGYAGDWRLLARRSVGKLAEHDAITAQRHGAQTSVIMIAVREVRSGRVPGVNASQ
jgi:hypothetical protein